MQSINMIMIYYWDKKLENRLHILEVDIMEITKHWFDVSNSEDAIFYRTCSKWPLVRFSQQ